MLYPPVDSIALGKRYIDHVGAMTAEGLHDKSDIAKQLAWRDQQIAALTARAEGLERERDELAGEVECWRGSGQECRLAQCEDNDRLTAELDQLRREKATLLTWAASEMRRLSGLHRRYAAERAGVVDMRIIHMQGASARFAEELDLLADRIERGPAQPVETGER